jgi:hypothetical protein
MFTLAFLTDYLSAGLSAFLSIRILPRFYDMLCHLGPFWAAVFESHHKSYDTPSRLLIATSIYLDFSTFPHGVPDFSKSAGRVMALLRGIGRWAFGVCFVLLVFLAFLCFATGSHQSQLGGYNESSFSLLLGSRRADLCFHDIVPPSPEEILGPKRGAVCN